MDASNPETAADVAAGSSHVTLVPRSFELSQARIFAEAARRTDAPWDSLPEGDDRPLRILLWQKAAFFALSACIDGGSDLDSVEVLRRAPRALVERAAGGSEWVSAVERALALEAWRGADAANNADGQLRILSRFVKRLLQELELPLERKQVARIKRFVMAGLALLVLPLEWQ